MNATTYPETIYVNGEYGDTVIALSEAQRDQEAEEIESVMGGEVEWEEWTIADATGVYMLVGSRTMDSKHWQTVQFATLQNGCLKSYEHFERPNQAGRDVWVQECLQKYL